uniref:Uncharacterized protein n=1 Tax=viral metagenome TaxID=1070528 RepID=A0A6M3L2G0_9ZZZZ
MKKEKNVTKKVMKTEPEKKAVNHDDFRKICNRILTKNKGLTLVENKHGAIQIKRDGGGGLLFSSRNDGVIVTHPMYEGTGKKKTRVYAISGGMWDDISRVSHSEITEAMLQARIDDKKSRADYHKEVYGKNPEKSGLVAKREAAAKRVAKVSKEIGKKKEAIKKETKEAKKASNVIQRKASKKISKKGKAAITRVPAPTPATA